MTSADKQFDDGAWDRVVARRCTLLGLAAAAAWLWLSATAEGQEIRLYPSAIVTEPVVRLADLAVVRAADATETTRLRQLVVAASPHPSAEAVVPFSAVRQVLIDADVNMATVRIMGATTCVVRRLAPPAPPKEKPTAPLTSRPADRAASSQPAAKRDRKPLHATERALRDRKTLEHSVRQFLAQLHERDGGRVHVRFSPACRDELALAGDGLEFIPRVRDDASLGLVALDVDVRRDDTVERTVSVVADVSLSRPVVVARQAINRGRIVTTRDVMLDERNFTRHEDVGLTDLTVAVGQEARGFVQPGAMLRVRDLRPAPLVRRGDAVTVWSRRGALVVKSAGRAGGDGALGDVVSIKSEAAREPFEAVVTGPRTVSIEGRIEVAVK